MVPAAGSRMKLPLKNSADLFCYKRKLQESSPRLGREGVFNSQGEFCTGPGTTLEFWEHQTIAIHGVVPNLPPTGSRAIFARRVVRGGCGIVLSAGLNTSKDVNRILKTHRK